MHSENTTGSSLRRSRRYWGLRRRSWATSRRTPWRRDLEVHNNSGVVLEVDEHTLSSPPGLTLSDDDGLQDLLPQLRLTLLDGNDNHVTRGSTGQTVKSGADTLNGDDVQVLTTAVISAVDQRRNAKTQGHAKLRATTAATSLQL